MKTKKAIFLGINFESILLEKILCACENWKNYAVFWRQWSYRCVWIFLSSRCRDSKRFFFLVSYNFKQKPHNSFARGFPVALKNFSFVQAGSPRCIAKKRVLPLTIGKRLAFPSSNRNTEAFKPSVHVPLPIHFSPCFVCRLESFRGYIVNRFNASARTLPTGSFDFIYYNPTSEYVRRLAR